MPETKLYDKVLAQKRDCIVKGNKREQTASLIWTADQTLLMGKLQSGQPQILLDLDLHGTHIAPGDVLKANDRIGFYTERIDIRVWVQGTYREPGWEYRWGPPGIVLADEKPDAAGNNAGSTSRTHSWTVNASGGLFDSKPIANAGAGEGGAVSVSRQIQDFAFSSSSGADHVHHHWQLSVENYDKNNPSLAFATDEEGFTEGSRLNNVPKLASSNFPINTVCAFQVSPDVTDTSARVVMLFRTTMVFFERWRTPIGPNTHETERAVWDQIEYLDYDWSGMTP